MLLSVTILLVLFQPRTLVSILQYPAHILVVRQDLTPSQAIVVLLGGKRIDRTGLAANLYQRKIASRIILCSGYLKRPLSLETLSSSPSDTLVWKAVGNDYKNHLLRFGVPAEAVTIIECPDIVDTASELSRIAQWLKEKHIRPVVLVTSASHSRRVSVVWSRVGKGIPATVRVAKDPVLDKWWHSKRSARVVLYEYGALIKEYSKHALENFMGLFD